MLFNKITDVIHDLKTAQAEAEELYLLMKPEQEKEGESAKGKCAHEPCWEQKKELQAGP